MKSIKLNLSKSKISKDIISLNIDSLWLRKNESLVILDMRGLLKLLERDEGENLIHTAKSWTPLVIHINEITNAMKPNGELDWTSPLLVPFPEFGKGTDMVIDVSVIGEKITLKGNPLVDEYEFHSYTVNATRTNYNKPPTNIFEYERKNENV